MKEIITGTQTAMAMPMDATPMEGTQAATETNGTPVAETTLKPKATKTPVPLPTSTQGPPPVVELKYNTKTCAPGLYICVVEHTKDIDATIQASYPWLQNNMELTFKMGPEGIYEFNKYIVVGTAKYEPDGSKGYGFRVTLNIPDSLRGMENIVVRLETNNPNYYGSDFFPNQ